MLRLFLILLLCALFAACSSDDSSSLKEWFDDQRIATSYGKDFQEIEVSLKSSDLGYDSSAYDVVSSFAALGNVNNVEQMLYFSVNSLSSNWKLRTDSTFYVDFNGGKFPEKIDAEFCWLVDSEARLDSLWLKFTEKLPNCKDITLNWKAGTSRDTFYISFPNEFDAPKTRRLLASIRITDNTILHIAKPDTSDISGLLRIAQKPSVKPCGDLCLHAGVRESLNVVLKIDEKIAEKTVVFAQLVLHKSSNTTGSELGLPVPVFVYNEEYKVDTTFVENYGHPNLVFGESDTLKLQVTRKLRNYVNADTISLTLRFGNPMLNPKSFSFSNLRPAYASYDFSTAFEEGKAKLRLWYAETDIH